MNVTDLIKRHEGLRLAAYDDATGKPVPAGGEAAGVLTIGYGHTGPDVTPGMVITEDQAELLLRGDTLTATRALQTVIGWPTYAALSANAPARCAALVDMAFNLGQERLSKFVKMIAAVKAGDWSVASAEAMKSAWFAETGRRGIEGVTMLRTGSWPDQEAVA